MKPSEVPPSEDDSRHDKAKSDDKEIDDASLRTVAADWAVVCSGDVHQSMTLKVDDSSSESSLRLLVIRERASRSESGDGGQDAEYELNEILGEGGMGVVYDARQTSMDRSVAVKVLKADRAERDHFKFLAEAKVTADLDHPNIVPVYDLGSQSDGALFYSMKRVQGTRWEEVIDQVSCEENLSILLRVADAVMFAHARGFIHRDLKPSNVMLGEYGEILVMDWGLAIPTDDNVKWRLSGRVARAGTPAYMAPEMATGGSQLGYASDIYLLGGILFRLLTGTTPHCSDTVINCVVAAAKNEIVDTDQRGELMDIAMRALATDPAQRFPDVRSFQAAIRDYQSHSESILLTERGERELADANTTGMYRTFARAMFCLEEALPLWQGNEKADRGRAKAKLAYASAALHKGDLDLAGSMLVEETPWPKESLAERDAVKAQLFARRSWLQKQKVLLGTVYVLVGLLMILGISLTLWLRGNASALAEQQQPVAEQSARCLANVQRSMADLFGWVLLDQESFKTARHNAWNEEILPALEQLKTLAKGARDSAEQARVDELQRRLFELRAMQLLIEVRQSDSGNIAQARLANEAVPMAAEVSALLAEIADEKSELVRNRLATISKISSIALVASLLLAVGAFLVVFNVGRQGDLRLKIKPKFDA